MDAIAAPERHRGYPLDEWFFDEAFEDEGLARPHYVALMAELEHMDLHELQLAVAGDLLSRGVAFQAIGGSDQFRVDPVPRLVSSAEWELLQAGLAQRVRALNAFLADAYG